VQQHPLGYLRVWFMVPSARQTPRFDWQGTFKILTWELGAMVISNSATIREWEYNTAGGANNFLM